MLLISGSCESGRLFSKSKLLSVAVVTQSPQRVCCYDMHLSMCVRCHWSMGVICLDPLFFQVHLHVIIMHARFYSMPTQVPLAVDSGSSAEVVASERPTCPQCGYVFRFKK